MNFTFRDKRLLFLSLFYLDFIKYELHKYTVKNIKEFKYAMLIDSKVKQEQGIKNKLIQKDLKLEYSLSILAHHLVSNYRTKSKLNITKLILNNLTSN